MDGIGLSRPQELALDEARCRKSGDNWNPTGLLYVQKYKTIKQFFE